MLAPCATSAGACTRRRSRSWISCWPGIRSIGIRSRSRIETRTKRAQYQKKLGSPPPTTWRNLTELDQIVTTLLADGPCGERRRSSRAAYPPERAPWEMLDRIATLRLHLGEPASARRSGRKRPRRRADVRSRDGPRSARPTWSRETSTRHAGLIAMHSKRSRTSSRRATAWPSSSKTPAMRRPPTSWRRGRRDRARMICPGRRPVDRHGRRWLCGCRQDRQAQPPCGRHWAISAIEGIRNQTDALTRAGFSREAFQSV